MKIILIWDGVELFGAAIANDDEVAEATAELTPMADDEGFTVQVYTPDTRDNLHTALKGAST